MDIHAVSKSVWRDLVFGRIECSFEFLAFKIMLTRLQARVAMNPSPDVVDNCINDLIEFFEKYQKSPRIQDDFRKIIRAGGVMYSLDQVIAKINKGESLFLSGSPTVLDQLPPGKWIGGSIPYFMAEEGGIQCEDKIFVTELPYFIEGMEIKKYNIETLHNIYADAAENGFSLIIIPYGSPTHLSFAVNSAEYKGFATKPLIGWISGVPIEEIGTTKPLIYDGSGQSYDDAAVVMHIKLPEEKVAEIHIINSFEQGKGDVISFPETGLLTDDVYINGELQNFSGYIKNKDIDIKLPLVSNYNGVMMNTSFQKIDNNTVYFYAPVFSGLKYKMAANPNTDYVQNYEAQLTNVNSSNIYWSCTCILNYLYARLEGRKVGKVHGPMTFGEIAYQLVNQTMVYVSLEDKK